MIVILGESASGKTTLVKRFIDRNPKYKKLVTYTTRPRREDEKNGVDYIFVNTHMFEELKKRDFFIETAEYRGWQYGTPKNGCGLKNAVGILTPSGLRNLKKQNIDVTSIYLMVDRRSRLIQSLCRGDDIEEAYRRNLSDSGQFDGVEGEVDYVIENTGFKMDEDGALECLYEILRVNKEETDSNYKEVISDEIPTE